MIFSFLFLELGFLTSFAPLKAALWNFSFIALKTKDPCFEVL